jgi:hypothetical protein
VSRPIGRVVAVLAGALTVAAVATPVASARDGFVTSFDGTKIVYSFFPASPVRPHTTGPGDLE